jgi:D-glycero-D-manno-heptose 1,7-bisphosphate phosphatase
VDDPISNETGDFLDRDGVVNEDHDYVYRSSSFRFIKGIFPLCRIAQRLKFSIVVVTNQAGIGRGLYSKQDFQKLTAWMLKEFSNRSIAVARVYHCPYHPRMGKDITGAIRQRESTGPV